MRMVDRGANNAFTAALFELLSSTTAVMSWRPNRKRLSPYRLILMLQKSWILVLWLGSRRCSWSSWFWWSRTYNYGDHYRARCGSSHVDVAGVPAPAVSHPWWSILVHRQEVLTPNYAPAFYCYPMTVTVVNSNSNCQEPWNYDRAGLEWEEDETEVKSPVAANAVTSSKTYPS